MPPSKSLLRSSSPAERRSSIDPAGLAAVFSQPGHFHIVNEWRWLRGLRTLHRIIRRGTWWGVHPLISSPLPLWQHHPAYHQRARETVYIVKNKEPIDSHYTRAQQETLRPPGVSVYFSMRIIHIVGIYKVALNDFFFLLHLFLYTVSPNWMLFAHCSMSGGCVCWDYFVRHSFSLSRPSIFALSQPFCFFLFFFFFVFCFYLLCVLSMLRPARVPHWEATTRKDPWSIVAWLLSLFPHPHLLERSIIIRPALQMDLHGKPLTGPVQIVSTDGSGRNRSAATRLVFFVFFLESAGRRLLHTNQRIKNEKRYILHLSIHMSIVFPFHSPPPRSRNNKHGKQKAQSSRRW